MSQGSSIPFIFSLFPLEFLSDDFLDDPIMLRFIFCLMRRVFAYPKIIHLKDRPEPLYLEPFEFMYGRETFSQEAGISECSARTRMKHLINLGYVEKVTKKSTIKYSVYRLIKEAFRQNSSQHINQKDNHQVDVPDSHKQETKIQKIKDIKKANAVSVSLSLSQQKDVIEIHNYCISYGATITEKVVERWVYKHSKEAIFENLKLLLLQKDSIRNPEAWMQEALKRKFAEKNKTESNNRKFAESFKELHNWRELTVLKQYCRHELSGKDYYYNLPEENFQRILKECYEQYSDAGGENA